MNSARITIWLDRYSLCHQNQLNKAIHWICVPTIMMTLLGLLWEIPFPQLVTVTPWWLNWSTLFVAGCLIFYFWLSPSLAAGMLICVSIMLGLIRLYTLTVSIPLWITCLAVFILAWIGQFIGHKIEGKKPAFFEDLQFLLIGPLWLLSFLYRKWGIPY